MKFHYPEYLRDISPDYLKKQTILLTEKEKPQTFSAFRQAAEFTLQLIQDAGIPEAELLEFPADGKTVIQDKKMPLGWDISCGRLTAVTNQRILADYAENPFNVVQGSVATPPGGIITRIITQSQFLAGENPDNALVMLNSDTFPNEKVLRPILDQGALGFVSDYLVGRYDTPDEVQWVNGCSEGHNWHITEEDRPFIGFSVSPRTGDWIRNECTVRQLAVRVECDGRRYCGTIPAVTARIPGKQKKEIWIIAHLFEPLLNDDSNGVVAGIEAARQIMKRGTPNFSVRLVFTMEYYGFAAYAEQRGAALKEEVLGACNLDGILALPGGILNLHPAGPALPFIGNTLLEELYEECKDALPEMRLSHSAYFDDMALGDPTIGIPVTWFLGEGPYWHNSIQCRPETIDWGLFHRCTALAAAYIGQLVNSETACPPVKPSPVLKEKHTPWRDYAEQMIFRRSSRGFPYALARVPLRKRIPLPDGMLYGTFANIIANIDGQKNLARIFLEAEAETGCEKKEQEIKKYIDALNFLADSGYLEVLHRPEITEEQITGLLTGMGINKKDLLLVHASTSGCGYVRGGAETIVRGIIQTAGTALFPTFTNPYIYLGGVNKNWTYSPFSPDNIDAVWTGEVGKTVLRNFPQAIRSSHITHSWAGIGPLAEACLKDHAPLDAPTGENSPLARALVHKGKILYFGTGLGPSTFLHYLEYCADAPFLDRAVCRIRQKDGTLQTVTIDQHLPGHRNFYRKDAENSKFFQQAVAAGLHIRRTALGLGFLEVIDIQELYDIGMSLFRKDPRIMLCDNPECPFCRRF